MYLGIMVQCKSRQKTQHTNVLSNLSTDIKNEPNIKLDSGGRGILYSMICSQGGHNVGWAAISSVWLKHRLWMAS